MKTTYSWKRITDEQIGRAFHIMSKASLLAKLMTVTGYPADKCLLALQYVKRRGLIEMHGGEPTLVQARVRSTGLKRLDSDRVPQ